MVHGKTGNKKPATYFATLLQNALNSNVARFITHIKPVLQQIRLLTGLNMGSTTRNIAIQLVLQHCCKTSCTFFVATAVWENSWHLASLPLVSPPNDVWETSAEIPYWWRVTTQIWVVTRHQSSQVKRAPIDIIKWIDYLKNESVSRCWNQYQIQLSIPACVMSK